MPLINISLPKALTMVSPGLSLPSSFSPRFRRGRSAYSGSDKVKTTFSRGIFTFSRGYLLENSIRVLN